MVVDIGGRHHRCGGAVHECGGRVVVHQDGRRAFDRQFIRYARRKHGIILGENAAEEVKLSIGCVYPRPENASMLVKGRDLRTGLPKEFTLQAEEILEALKRPVRQILDEIFAVLEQTPPELVADLAQNGIVLTGGGSLIWGAWIS